MMVITYIRVMQVNTLYVYSTKGTSYNTIFGGVNLFVSQVRVTIGSSGLCCCVLVKIQLLTVEFM